MTCGIVCAILIVTLHLYLRRQNRERDALTPEDKQKWIDEGRTGDAHPDYRFIL